MGDTIEPPSSAAQRAQNDTDDQAERGFFSRLVDALSPQDTDDRDKEPSASERAQRATALGTLNLRRMRVEDVMVPKADIKAVSSTSSKDELVEVFRDCGLTRLPVFEGTLDTPLGFVNLKDFALRYGFNGKSTKIDLAGLIRPLIYVPPSMPLGILLQKMPAERTHMALVIDEYGGTDGLVTIEDLIEQVVGAIEDEHDVAEAKSWVKEKDGVYLALAKTTLEDFEAEIGRKLTEPEEIDEEEVDTLGGLVFMLGGHVPVRGEVVQHPEGLEFEVIDADPRRVKRLRVRLPHAANG